MPQSDGVLVSEAAAPAARAGRDAATLIAAFRDDLLAGRAWFEALLDVVAVWELPVEVVDGREFRYLIGGEAFDWLLLAERICDAVEPGGLLPADEVEALLMHERLPRPMTEEALKQRLGPSKYRAHLNFVYGVRVEEALQLSVEERVHKDRGSTMLSHDTRSDGDVFTRIYGASRWELLDQFRASQERPRTDRISLTELREFTYWLFKHRVNVQDPARVASDTRRGLLTLHRLEALAGRRRPPAATPPLEEADAVIDIVAGAVS